MKFNLNEYICLLCSKNAIEESNDLPICRKIDGSYLMGDLIIAGYIDNSFKQLDDDEIELYKEIFNDFEVYLENCKEQMERM